MYIFLGINESQEVIFIQKVVVANLRCHQQFDVFITDQYVILVSQLIHFKYMYVYYNVCVLELSLLALSILP